MAHKKLSSAIGFLSIAAAAAGAQVPSLDFSGVIFTNFQMRSDSTARAQNSGKNSSKFDVERVYLTFRMPAGEKFSIRATTEVLNNNDAATNGYYKGWAMRFKYAYLQYAFVNNAFGVTGLNGTARMGMLHNVIIEHEEQFWPRFLSQVEEERTAAMFSSSDVGAALLVNLPHKLGEVYTTVVNGTGYAASENDRFKDVAARVTITPLANSDALGAIGRSITISPWIYEGHTASKFAVAEGLDRSRRGVFVGERDPRITLGLSLSERTETVESGENTAEHPRTTTEVSGRVSTFFGIVRPGAWVKPGTSLAKWGVLGRVDTFRPSKDADPANQLSIISLFIEPTSKVTLSLDMQKLARKDGSVVPETRTLFFHIQALF